MMIRHKSMALGLALLLVAGSWGLPASAAGSAVAVSDVRILGTANAVTVQVVTSGPASHKAYMTTAPRRTLIVDLSPALLADGAGRRAEVNKGMVERVTLTQFGPDTVRVSIDLVDNPVYVVATAPGGRGINISVGMKPSAPQAAALPVPPKPAVKRAPLKKEKLISLDFVNADLIYVLKLLAKESNANIVADSSVKGSVTMTLNNVPLNTALALVVKTSGYDMKRIKSPGSADVILVGPAASLDKIQVAKQVQPTRTGPQSVDAVIMEYADAATVAAAAQAAYPDVTFTAEPGANAILLRGPGKSVQEAKAYLATQDVPKQVSKSLPTVLELKYLKAADLDAEAWKTLFPNIAWQSDQRTNSLLITGSDEEIAKFRDYLARVDIPLAQVELDVKVVELRKTASKHLGISWPGTASFTLLENSGANGDGSTGQQGPTNAYNPFGFASFSRSPLSFLATLNLLITTNEAKVLSSPKVVTQNNTDAMVHVGDQNVTVVKDPRSGATTTQKLDSGVKLTIKPSIGADGYIVTDLTAEVISFDTTHSLNFPDTSNRTASTTMRVKDGDTIVIGGLMHRSKVKIVSRVPLLSDIPVLGKLFTDNNESNDDYTELVITVTPRILNQ